MTRYFALALLLSMGSLSAAPVPKETTPQFLVVLKKEKFSQLFLVDADGKNAKALTDDQSNASYPQWSPDGKKIAFSSDRSGVMHICVMDADGKKLKTLTDGDFMCRVPSWSPDGKNLIFCRRTAQGSSEICEIPAGGGEVKVIDVGGDAWDPAISPDGKKIAFVSLRDFGGFRLYVTDADGKNPKRLIDTGNNFGFAYPAWSPDGKTIALGHNDGQSIHIQKIDADGSNLTKLTTEKGMQIYPHWSPDGKKILYYQSTSQTKGNFVVMDADGKNGKVVIADVAAVEGGRPCWRPR